MEEKNVFYMEEETAEEIIEKIYEMATSIRNDWQDPRSECREIWRLCDKLKKLINKEVLDKAN